MLSPLGFCNIFRFSAFVFQRVPVACLSRALRAIYKYAANWWFDPADGQCFVFRSHIFFLYDFS